MALVAGALAKNSDALGKIHSRLVRLEKFARLEQEREERRRRLKTKNRRDIPTPRPDPDVERSVRPSACGQTSVTNRKTRTFYEDSSTRHYLVRTWGWIHL